MIFKNSWCKIFCAVSIVLTAAACSEDFFTQTVELEGNWDGPEMIVHARLNAQDDTLGIHLQKSQPIFGESTSQYGSTDHIVDAEVILKGDDGTEYEFYFDSLRTRGLNYFAPAEPALKEGVTYTLHIEHPDFEPVEVKEMMPPAPELISYNWTKDYRFEPLDSIYYTQLELRYENNREDRFMSHLFEFTFTENGNTRYGSFDLEPREFELGSFEFGYEVFESVSLSGNAAVAYFEVPTADIENLLENRPEVQLIVYSNAILEADFLFHRSVQQHYEFGDSPFAEPVIVYSNIDNANGLFSLLNTTETSIPFPE